MDERTAATRRDVEQAIDSLTSADLLNLKWAAKFRVHSLGRAAKGRTDEDLLMEAVLFFGGYGRPRRWQTMEQEYQFQTALDGSYEEYCFSLEGAIQRAGAISRV